MQLTLREHLTEDTSPTAPSTCNALRRPATASVFARFLQLGYLSRVTASTSAHVRILDRYALYDEIASGGMATVHVGRLLGPVGFSRTVAIKRLHPQYAKEPDFVSMFLDEARLAARIRHPNVVGTLDVVALDGELFLVMEYVHGESLARLMRAVRERGASVPIPIAAAILVDILEGLHAAHEATNDHGAPLGIVHRDVSPQNILVGTDGIARVLDFGVAKAAGRVQNTRDGQLKGKLGYMAPEQIAGSATRTTDVHAASVVLWEMLTGRRLYHAENELQTYANILAGTVKPPSAHNPNVGRDLDEVVLQGLKSNPEARFPSAREMARALLRTTGLASASDVGDWLQEIAGPDIRARAQKVAAIESTGSPPPLSSQESRESVFPSSPPVSMGLRRRLQRVPRRPLVVVPVVTTLAAILAVGIYLGISARGGAAQKYPPSAGDGHTANATSSPVRLAAPTQSAPTAWPPVVAPTAPPSAPSAFVSRVKPAQPPGLRAQRGATAVPATASPSAWPETVRPPDDDYSHVLDSRK
jgi:serine/threonine-protein kinase